MVFDFDGSLATTFVGGLIFRGHVPETVLESSSQKYLSNTISLREYQVAVFDSVDETPRQMSNRAAENAAVRQYSKDVCEAVWRNQGKVAVASSGLDLYINPVLENTGLQRIEVHCGHVVSNPAKLPPLSYEYPSSSPACQGDWVTCKCKVINDLKLENPDSEIIFVGDGTDADRCATRNAADTVFASGRLFEYCKKNGIPATEFRNSFRSLLQYVLERTSLNGAK